MRHDISTPPTFNASVASTTSLSIDLNEMSAISVQANYTNDAPDAQTFTSAADVDVDEDSATIAAHPYVTGTKVALTTDDTLPTGLSATNYYIIVVDEDTVQLASSLANAVAGTAVDITAAGTGTHTLTAATSAGNVLKLQSSNDGANWTDVSGKTVTIATTAGTAQWDIDRPAYRYLRVLYTPSAGQVALETIISQVIG